MILIVENDALTIWEKALYYIIWLLVSAFTNKGAILHFVPTIIIPFTNMMLKVDIIDDFGGRIHTTKYTLRMVTREDSLHRLVLWP